MFIDIVFVVLMVLAIFKGYSRGLIVALFSFFAFLAGLAAALKLSAVVADALHKKMNISGYWLPVLSFALVFIAVVFIVRAVAAILKKVARLAFLGWADAFGGILLYAVIYVMIYSVILFYATKVGLISNSTQKASVTYSFVEPAAPAVINGMGKAMPFFSNMFSDLSQFFQNTSGKLHK